MGASKDRRVGLTRDGLLFALLPPIPPIPPTPPILSSQLGIALPRLPRVDSWRLETPLIIISPRDEVESGKIPSMGREVEKSSQSFEREADPGSTRLKKCLLDELVHISSSWRLFARLKKDVVCFNGLTLFDELLFLPLFPLFPLFPLPLSW